MYAVNGHVIKIDGINGIGGKLIEVLQFHEVFAYFQFPRRYLTDFKISVGVFSISFTRKGFGGYTCNFLNLSLSL
jgi:hypothetical protein